MTTPLDGAGAGAEPGDPGVGAGVRSGLRWSVASQLGLRVVNVLAGIILFRLLGPENYGVYAFALAVNTIVISFNDLGQVMAIVRWEGEGYLRAARTATTLAWVGSAVCFGIVFAGAGLLAGVSGNGDAAGPIRLLAGLILVDGFTTTPRALLFRDFRHSRTSIGDLVGLPVNVGLAVLAALAGAGAYAPAAGTLVAACVTGAIVYVSAPSRPRPGFDPADARRLFGFGLPLALTTLVELTLLNVDYLIIGSQLGAVALGYYALAFNVSSWPSNFITQAIRRVSVAGFSRVNTSAAQLAAAFTKSFTMLMTLLLLVCTGLAVLASPLVRTLYGSDATPAGHVLSWLIVLGGLRVAVGLVFDVLLAEGRSRATLRLNLLWLAAVVPALWVGAQYSITGVAVAHTIVAACWAVPLHFLAVRDLGITAGALVRPLLRPAIGAAVAVAVGVPLVLTLEPDLLVLAVAGPLMLGIFLTVGVPPGRLRQVLRSNR